MTGQYNLGRDVATAESGKPRSLSATAIAVSVMSGNCSVQWLMDLSSFAHIPRCRDPHSRGSTCADVLSFCVGGQRLVGP